MGLSLFYTLSLPATKSATDVERDLAKLSNEAQRVAFPKKIAIGKVKMLSSADLAMAQATMNDNFDFARAACRPPSANINLTLGEVPEIAFYFRMCGDSASSINIGVSKYKTDAIFQVVNEISLTELPYDGRWFFWNLIDGFSENDSNLLRRVLNSARIFGFETTYRNEADDVIRCRTVSEFIDVIMKAPGNEKTLLEAGYCYSGDLGTAFEFLPATFLFFARRTSEILDLDDCVIGQNDEDHYRSEPDLAIFSIFSGQEPGYHFSLSVFTDRRSYDQAVRSCIESCKSMT